MSIDVTHDADREATVRAFRESAHALLRAESPIARLRSMRGSNPGYNREMWERLADAGWTGLCVPAVYDGMGRGLREMAAIANEIGRHPLPEPVVGGAFMSVTALASLPSGELRNRLLTDLASGRLIIGVACQLDTEQVSSDSVAASAAGQGGDLLLSGVVRGVYPAGADGWLVAASHSEGKVLCFVNAEMPGLTVTEQERVDGSMSATLTFDELRLPCAQVVARDGHVQSALASALADTRVVQAAELLGLGQQAYDDTLEYLKTRTQFGRPIGANQALQHRMVDALLQLELARAALDTFLGEHPEMPEDAEVLLARDASHEARCARVKARCAHAALHMCRLAIQFHGAIGYTDELNIGLYLKRALHLAAWLGGARENRLLAASLVLGESPDESSSLERTGQHAETHADQTSDHPSDIDWNALPDQEFRARIRRFVQQNYPDALRNPPRRLHWPEMREWYLALSRQGWIAPAWPREYGGMALEPDKLIAFMEEMESYGVARAPDQGIINIGPVLIKYGTPEQKGYYLPRILSGEHIWCQGYSEPNAGSDLASLRTEAIIDGDDFVVTGQKIWTTLAQDANHIFMLVRTDKNARKQAGISFLLTELDRPGITVRPITNIGGEQEFCEVFFDHVRVPRTNLVGDINQGWTIAKALLDFERLFVGSPNQARYALNQLRLLGEMNGAFELANESARPSVFNAADPSFVERYVEAALDVADLQALFSDYAAIVKRGGTLPPSVSLLKIWASETYSRLAMMCVEAAGSRGGDAASLQFRGVTISPANRLYNSSITTIYGGSNEIQRNILAKAVLGLPTT